MTRNAYKLLFCSDSMLSKKLESVVDGKWIDTYTCKDRVCDTLPGFGYFDGKRVLDLGCSKGVTSSEIYDRADCLGVVGIDLNSDRVRWAKKNFSKEGLDFVCGDGLSCFGDEKFGAVLAMNNYLFSMGDDFDGVLDSVLRLVEDKGVVIFATTRAVSRSYGGFIVGGDYIVLEKNEKKVDIVDFGLIEGKEGMRSYDIARENIEGIYSKFSQRGFMSKLKGLVSVF